MFGGTHQAVPLCMELRLRVLLVQLVQTPDWASGSLRQRAAPWWGAKLFRMLQGRGLCPRAWAG